MAFNPDDKIQWENLAPTLQALLEQKIQEGNKKYFDVHINSYIGRAIETSNKYTDQKAAALQNLINKNESNINKLSNTSQTGFTELKNSYNNLSSRLDGNEFVKSKDKANKIELKYEAKDGETEKSLHAYVDGVEVQLGAGGLADNIRFIERPDITTAKSATKTGHATSVDIVDSNGEPVGGYWRTIIWEDGWYQVHGSINFSSDEDGIITDPNGNKIFILADIPIYLKKDSILEYHGDLYYFTNTIKYATITGQLIEQKDCKIIAGTPYMQLVPKSFRYAGTNAPGGVDTSIGRLETYIVSYCIPIYLSYGDIPPTFFERLVPESITLEVGNMDLPYLPMTKVDEWIEKNKVMLIEKAKGKMRYWTDKYVFEGGTY